MNGRHQVWRMVASSGGARGYVLLSEFALLLMTAHWLSISERGDYAAALSLIKGMTIVSFLSLGQMAIHRFAHCEGAAERGRTVANLLAANVVLPAAAVAIFVLVAALSAAVRQRFFLPFGLASAIALPLFVAEQYLNGLLLSLGRLHAFNLWTVVGRTVAWMLTIVAIQLMSWDAMGVIAAVIVGQAVLVVGALTTARSALAGHAVRMQFERSDFVAMLGSGAKLHPSALGALVFGSLDVLLVFNHAGASAAALYQLALQMVSAMSILPFAVGQVGYAQVAQQGPAVAWRRYRGTLWWSSLPMLAASVVIGVTAYTWLPLLLGREYAPAVPLFQVMLVGFPGMMLSIGMAPQWVGRGHFSASSILTIASGVIGVSANLWAIPRYGAGGAAAVFCGMQLLSLLTNGVYIYLISKGKA